MKIITVLFVLALILLAPPAGGRIAAEMSMLILGTALPIQLLIHSVRGFRALRPLRDVLVAAFARRSTGFGFSLLVLLGVFLIALEIFLLRNLVPPSNSWVPVTLGFLWGIMGPVFRTPHRGERNRESGVELDTL